MVRKWPARGHHHESALPQRPDRVIFMGRARSSSRNTPHEFFNRTDRSVFCRRFSSPLPVKSGQSRPFHRSTPGDAQPARSALKTSSLSRPFDEPTGRRRVPVNCLSDRLLFRKQPLANTQHIAQPFTARRQLLPIPSIGGKDPVNGYHFERQPATLCRRGQLLIECPRSANPAAARRNSGEPLQICTPRRPFGRTILSPSVPLMHQNGWYPVCDLM